MRILHTIAGCHVGGIEFRVLDQVEWLICHGHFAAISAHPESAVAAAARNRQLPLVPIDFERPYSLATILALRRTLRKLSIDVVDTHGRRDSQAAALCQNLSAVVRTRHFSGNTKRSLRRRLEWSRGCAQVIATCETAAKALTTSGLVVRERLSVVGEWASDEFFAKANDPMVRIKMRRYFNLNESAFVVATIGMLRPDKCQEDLLHSVALLRKRGIPAVALIIGSATHKTSGYELHLKQLSDHLGLKEHTVFTGFRTDVSDVIQAADAVLVPSLIEAWSRVVPEAYAARRPVVASCVGGLPELVRPNVTGWLAEARDITGFADQLAEIRSQPEKTRAIVATARLYADRSLRLDAKMDQTLKVYQTAMMCSSSLSQLQKTG